ncbi:MAG TPA: ATP-binding protein [Rhizomicrobium sp.]|jgi:signal transduction histidine kinase|nr:ATP-binding protein [Rhizomicrobium sp.]
MTSVALNDSARAPSLRSLWLALTTYAGFVVLGYGGIYLSGPGHNSQALIWPPTAFAVVMIARLARNRAATIIMLAAVFLAEATISFTGRTLGALGVGLCFVATIEVLAGVFAIRRLAPKRVRDMGDALRFGLLAMILPCALGGLLAQACITVLGPANWKADGLHWFTTHVLAFFIILPFGLNVSWHQFAKLDLRRRWVEALVVFAALFGISLFALSYFQRPLAVLIIPAALAATVRFRLLGSAVAMFMVLAIIFTKRGLSANDIVLAQAFLAVLSVITARTAMYLNERDLYVAIVERHRQRAARASRFKSELLSHVSAEARGPLTAIIGFSGMLESGELSPARAQEFAHIVAHNGELLQRLYGDLLDITRAAADDLSIAPEKVDVVPTLKSCISAIRQEVALGGKPVVMDKIEDMAIQADPQRLAQILNNLIANSYKYGDNHSPIRVRASRLDDGFGRIEISNSGPGIPIRERDTIFKPFGSEGGGRQVPGAMLGLSIAKVLAEKQGGRIDFESIPGRQTRFWIDLPLVA